MRRGCGLDSVGSFPAATHNRRSSHSSLHAIESSARARSLQLSRLEICGSDDLIVPALLRGTDVFDAPDDAPRCRLHFSLTAHGARGFELLGEAQLRKEGFLPLGAYDHLCATLMVWAQRTIKGRHEPKLKRQSIEIRLSKHTLVRAARPMRMQSCRHNACRPSAVRRRLLPHPSPPLAALQMHAAPRPLRASTS
jgi:hypothetical protein